MNNIEKQLAGNQEQTCRKIQYKQSAERLKRVVENYNQIVNEHGILAYLRAVAHNIVINV
jgi:hypothetical protein